MSNDSPSRGRDPMSSSQQRAAHSEILNPWNDNCSVWLNWNGLAPGVKGVPLGICDPDCTTSLRYSPSLDRSPWTRVKFFEAPAARTGAFCRLY